MSSQFFAFVRLRITQQRNVLIKFLVFGLFPSPFKYESQEHSALIPHKSSPSSATCNYILSAAVSTSLSLMTLKTSEFLQAKARIHFNVKTSLMSRTQHVKCAIYVVWLALKKSVQVNTFQEAY